MSKEKQLTELQIKFLEVLFGEAQGDPVKAKELAGYSETTRVHEILKGLRKEIIEQAEMVLAVNSPRAAFEMVNVMINGTVPGATTKLNAAKEILNRVGVSEKKSEDVNLKVPSGGLFILPAKGAKVDEEEVQ